MDSRFFGSKYFAVAAAVAAAILVGAASAYYMTDAGATYQTLDACDAPALGGSEVSVTPRVEVDDDGERRMEAYTWNTTGLVGGRLDLCLAVGEIDVEPADGDALSVEVETYSGSARAVADTKTEVRFAKDGDRLVLAAWESARGAERSLFDGNGAAVRLVLRVPPSGAFTVHATNDVGDIRVSGLMVEDPTFQTDVGSVLVRNVDVVGNATLISNVGDTILHATSVTSGAIRLTSDVGNAEAQLPQRADVGYDVTATTDVGEAFIAIGDVESSESEGEGPGEHRSARTSGFASKPTRVTVEATTDVGDARIVAS